MSIIISLPFDYRFDCPEGKHRVAFYDHLEKSTIKNKKPQRQIRLRFKIPSLSTETETMLVCKNFAPTLKAGSELRSFIEMWLGDNFIKAHSKGRQFNFDSLNGLEGDAVVKHISNDGYDEPYVCLESIYPPGTLIQPPHLANQSNQEEWNDFNEAA